MGNIWSKTSNDNNVSTNDQQDDKNAPRIGAKRPASASTSTTDETISDPTLKQKKKKYTKYSKKGRKDKRQVDNRSYGTRKEKEEDTDKNVGEQHDSDKAAVGESKGPRIPKIKAALLVGYNGTGYQGMQLNPNAASIEGVIFDALCKAEAISKDNADDPRKSNWMRAARTDKGVHAAGNILSLKMQIPPHIPDLVEHINSFLPPQIRVWGYVQTIRSFHSKNLCDSRIYEYLLPTCAFMEPIKQELTDHPQFEDDLVIANKNLEHTTIKYTPRSSPEVIKKRHDYRATPEQLLKFKLAMKMFEGTHNFHNYTNGKSFKDQSSKRFMKTIDVSEPMYIHGSEWVKITLHGQSFMLHQIRKMISMGMLVTRTNTPLHLIPKTFEENRINIPKAPALGLLLERPIFHIYNTKVRTKSEAEREEIDFDKYKDRIEQFKREWIYDKIFDAENERHIFDGYLTSLDAHYGPDYLYLNPEGVIPEECLVKTKFNSNANAATKQGGRKKKKDSDEEVEEEEDGQL
ncbi:pseudouridine synthase [Mycotypha africana]|uniref:pseudouridine synthase n=1 Tax=Mycotypha africana TaxID=64632 RepID=UPI00230108CD|nr:pseudouridine synthase [Mycotypha africana]KAI8991141.1 pseudouridine synthase [Mycotypha africana]